MLKKQFNISSFYLTCIISFYFITVLNYPFWAKVYSLISLDNFFNIGFFVSIYIFLFSLLTFFLSFIVFKYLTKFCFIILIISGVIINYFMINYGIVVDEAMVANALATDTGEAFELLNFALFFHIIIYGLVPILFVFKVNIIYGSIFRQLLSKIFIICSSVIIILIIAGLYYKDYSSLVRNNRILGFLINPSNYIVATFKQIQKQYFSVEVEFNPLAIGSEKGESWKIGSNKKIFTIIVIGEAARANNFSLNGYSRNTNPLLEKEKNIINFNNFSSCGTSTAVSLPCIFSPSDRNNFSVSNFKNYDNLLDIIKATDIDVFWRDNNSGSKGITARLKNHNINNLSSYKNSNLCNNNRCYDEILIAGLGDYLDDLQNDTVLVLHQLGNHGPTYYLRYPDKFKKFNPVCDSSDLSSCSRDSILNAYDNGILYTDYNLSLIINLLKKYSDKLDTAMFYVSDHGESLGENGVYLHGLPYFIAPSEQTHIPSLLWLSNSVKQRFKIDDSCLSAKANDKLSHDNFFHSILGFLDIQNSEYNKGLDIFNNCKN